MDDDRRPSERRAELVTAAAYGSVLVLAALSVTGVSDVALGHGAEIVAGVGMATWLAHLFAELLGAHVTHPEPLHRHHVRQAAVDGSPILLATVAPAAALLLGRLDVVGDTAARLLAITVAILQLLAIGVYVARVAPAAPATRWSFVAAVVTIGFAVAALTLALGH